MAAECLEFPPIEAAVPEEEQMAAPQSKTDWKSWATLAIAAVGLGGGAIWGIAHEFSQLDKHITRVEMAVRIIGAKQGGDTKTLVDEALSLASLDSSNGHPDKATVALNIANHLLQEQKEAHTVLPQEAFSKALAQYQTLKKSPALRSAAHEGIVQLAEYRTATVEPASPGQHMHIGHLENLRGGFVKLQDSYISGDRGFANSTEGTDIDGFIMQNVVFENATIVYHGGPLVLQNVRFINCRFKVSDSLQGDQLLTAAIEQQTDAKIG